MGVLDPDVVAMPGASGGGAHACLVFDAADERIERTATWIRDGLDQRQRVVYVEPLGAEGRLAADLRQLGLDIAAPVRDGKLVLLPVEQALEADADWDVQRRIARHEQFIGESLDAGFAGVRMAGEAAAALRYVPDVAELCRFEAAVEALTLRLPLSVMCFYNRAVFDADLGSIALVHPRGIEDHQMRVFSKPGHVTMVGEVDCSNTDLMTQILGEAVPVGGRVVIDLGGVSFIDVGGTSQLVELARRLGGADCLRIVDPPRHLQRILAAADWQNELELVAGGAV